MPNPNQEKGILDTLVEFFTGPKTALDSAAAQGTPAVKVTPAQDNSYLQKAVADSMKTKASRDKLSPEAAKALATPPRKRKMP